MIPGGNCLLSHFPTVHSFITHKFIKEEKKMTLVNKIRVQ